MSRVSPAKLEHFVRRGLRLDAYLACPGDGRARPQIPARELLWPMLFGQVVRECSFAAIEALVHSKARAAFSARAYFGDDALAYFTERLDPAPTRTAACGVLKQAKRNKAFDDTHLICRRAPRSVEI